MQDLKHLMFQFVLLQTVWSCQLKNPQNLTTANTTPDAECRYNTTYTWDKQAQKNDKDQPTISLSCLDHVDLGSCGQSEIIKASWKFFNKPISAASDPRYVFNKAKGELSITNFNKRYAGEYQVTYWFGSQKVSCQLCVFASPLVVAFFGKSEADRYFLTGQDADVSQNFEILGYPVDEVQWMKDDQVLVASNRVILGPVSLMIKSAEKSDSGSYTCTAVSSSGVSSKSQNIYFKFKYEWVYPLGGIGLELVLFLMVFICNSVRKKNKLRRKELRQKIKREKYLKEQRRLAEERESSSKDGGQATAAPEVLVESEAEKSGTGNDSELRSRTYSKTLYSYFASIYGGSSIPSRVNGNNPEPRSRTD